MRGVFSLPSIDLSCGLCDGRAEPGEAVEDGNPDLELGDLTVELARGEALARELGAVHPGLGAASAVIPTGGELGRADFQRFLVDPDMKLAPDPPLRAAMLAGVPFPFALDLDPGAVYQQVKRAVRAAVGDVHLQRSRGLRGATCATVPSHSGDATAC